MAWIDEDNDSGKFISPENDPEINHVPPDRKVGGELLHSASEFDQLFTPYRKNLEPHHDRAVGARFLPAGADERNSDASIEILWKNTLVIAITRYAVERLFLPLPLLIQFLLIAFFSLLFLYLGSFMFSYSFSLPFISNLNDRNKQFTADALKPNISRLSQMLIR